MFLVALVPTSQSVILKQDLMTMGYPETLPTVVDRWLVIIACVFASFLIVWLIFQQISTAMNLAEICYQIQNSTIAYYHFKCCSFPVYRFFGSFLFISHHYITNVKNGFLIRTFLIYLASSWFPAPCIEILYQCCWSGSVLI